MARGTDPIMMRIHHWLLCGLCFAVHGAASATAAPPIDADYERARYYKGATGQALDLGRYETYLEKSARGGNVTAQAELGFLYFNGNSRTPKNLPSSFRWFDEAARRGSVVAQCMLGDFYRDGLGGVARDPAHAVRLYRHTATRDDRCAPKSQYELYVSYDAGNGVARDRKAAMAWLKRAAESGNPVAQLTLGKHYRDGYGVPRDAELARKWMKKSREGVAPHDDEEEGEHHH